MEERVFGPLRFIPGEMKGGYPFCHSLYIEGDGVLIDPSSDRERLSRLREGPGVKLVWLTHWHEDHWMHIDLFDDVPLWMSRPDSIPMSDLEVFLDAYGVPEDAEKMREDFRDLLREQFPFRPRFPDRFFQPGEIVELNAVNVEVLHTPGHTPGHLSFFFPESEILFLGDYDLTGFGPWYGDAYSSLEQTFASMERLREFPAKVWLASHGTGIFEKEPGERWERYIGTVLTREEKLLDLLSEPRTMEEIVNAWIVYGRQREPKLFFEFGERAIMSKHLVALMEKGRVVFEGQRYFRI